MNDIRPDGYTQDEHFDLHDSINSLPVQFYNGGDWEAEIKKLHAIVERKRIRETVANTCDCVACSVYKLAVQMAAVVNK